HRHQDQDRVAAGEDPVQAGAEQQDGQHGGIGEVHQRSPSVSPGTASSAGGTAGPAADGSDGPGGAEGAGAADPAEAAGAADPAEAAGAADRAEGGCAEVGSAAAGRSVGPDPAVGRDGDRAREGEAAREGEPAPGLPAAFGCGPVPGLPVRSERAAVAVGAAFALRDRTIAPTRAARRRTERASKGRTQCWKRAAPVTSVEPAGAPSRSIQVVRKASTTTQTRVPAAATATASANHRLPESASGERPMGALVSIRPNRMRTMTEPT